VVDIRMSERVRAALGPDGVRRIMDDFPSLTGGYCPVCKLALPAEGPANVLLVCSPTTMQAAFAHPRCTDSTIIDVSEDTMTAATPDEDRMDVSALMLEHAGTLLPVLVAELPMHRAYAAQGPAGHIGELTNAVVSGLMSWGFDLVMRLRQAPRATLDVTATIRPGAGAAVQLDIPALAAGQTGYFYSGTAHPPQGWAEATGRYGWCVLYAGGVGLGPEGTEADALKALRAAAGRGKLVGVRLPVAWEPA